MRLGEGRRGGAPPPPRAGGRAGPGGGNSFLSKHAPAGCVVRLSLWSHYMCGFTLLIGDYLQVGP